MGYVIDMASALPIVFADFAPVLGANTRPRLVFLDGRPDAAVSDLVGDTSQWMPAGQGEQVLLTIGESVASLESAWGDQTSLIVEIASLLQEFVMDSLNTTWPVKSGQGGVAEPTVVDGQPVWLWPDESIPIGQLSR